MTNECKRMNLREVLAELPQDRFAVSIYCGDRWLGTGTPEGFLRQRWVNRPESHYVEEVTRNEDGHVRITIASDLKKGE